MSDLALSAMRAGWVCAVDVGISYHAQAWFLDGVLRQARLLNYVEPITNGVEPFRLYIEVATPRESDGRKKLREVNALNRSAGRLGALHPSPQYWLPEEWKGQLSKERDHRRTLNKRLSDVELLLLPKSKAELKHVLDAVGIGLRAVGRRR